MTPTNRACTAIFLCLIGVSAANAQCDDGGGGGGAPIQFETVTIIGYASPPASPPPPDFVDLLPVPIAQNNPQTPPVPSSGPGGKYSASPNSHTNCTNTTLSQALDQGDNSSKSSPNSTSIAASMRYANPVGISNNSPIGQQYGGVNGAAGFMVFPNLSKGTQAALASANSHAQLGFTIYGLVNEWAPVSDNPNTMKNFLAGLGISQATAQATPLSSLTATQLLQMFAAFAWQERFKPAGC